MCRSQKGFNDPKINFDGISRINIETKKSCKNDKDILKFKKYLSNLQSSKSQARK